MRKLFTMILVLMMIVSLASCKDSVEFEPVDMTEYVEVEYTEEGIRWDWSEVDFDDYNWFQDIFRDDTRFRTDIHWELDGTHRFEFYDKYTDELIGYAEVYLERQ